MLVLLRYALRFLLLTTAVILVAMAVLTGLLRLGLPYASTYKNDIQAWVSDYLGSPVEIGTMTVEWSGFSPRLALDKISLKTDGKNNIDAKLDEIQLDLNLIKSLVTGDLHTNEVTISGAALSVEYFGRRNFKITGLGFQDDNTDEEEKGDSSLDVLSWLMNARRVGLLNSHIKLIDKVRGIDYQLNNLNIRAENTRLFHQLRVDLQLPEQLGKKLEIGLDLRGTRSNLNASKGNFYINAEAMILQDWMNIWPQRTIEAEGHADVEVWGSWSDKYLKSLRGKLDGSDITLAANDVTSGSDLTPAFVKYPSLTTDLTWQRTSEGWVTEIDQLDFTHDNVLNSFQHTVVEKFELDSGDGYRVSGAGDGLHLDSLTQLMETFATTPKLAPLATMASQSQFTGDLIDWRVDMETRPGVLPMLSVHSDLVNVSSKPYLKLPGVTNLTATVAVENNVGSLSINSKDFSLQHPKLFPQPIALSEVSGDVDINLGDADLDDGIKVDPILSSDAIILRDEGVIVNTSVAIHRSGEDLSLDINSDFSVDDLSKVSNYLPGGILRPRLHTWLKNAFVTGKATGGKLKFFGNPAEFPFTDGNGIFKVDFDVSEAALRFSPSWPVATEINGTVHFEGPGLRFEASKANIAGVRVSRFNGGISDMRRSILTLNGATIGRLNNYIKFANTGPLKSILSPALAESRGSGNATLNIEVGLPLISTKYRRKNERLKVNGALFLKDNNLEFDRFSLELEDATGAVVFSERGVTANRVTGNFMGSTVSVDAKTNTVKGERQTDLRVKGLVRLDRVFKRYQIPLDSFFAGPSRWRVDVSIPYGSGNKKYPGVTLKASSDMVGTMVSFPQPLNKSSGKPRDVSVLAKFDAVGNQTWNISDGQHKTQVRVKPGEGMQSLAVVLGNGKIADGFTRGIRIDGNAPTMAFDGWIETVTTIINTLPKSEGSNKPIMPVHATVSTGNMQVGNQLLGPSSARINTDENFINGVIDSEHLRGNIRLPRAHWDSNQAVKVRIAYADKVLLDALKTKAPGSVETKNPIDPRVFPRLEIHASQIALNTVTLKEVGIRTEPDTSGMTISAIGFSSDTAQMVGSGVWHLKDPQQLNPQLEGQQVTRFELNLQSADLGRTLTEFGIEDAISEGNGTARVVLGWQDAVYKPSVQSLSGDAELYLKKGRIISIEPGAAKLVGLFALQELPRRLSLDFRDVVNDGLNFNTISGSVKLKNGVATTELLQIKGPVGVIDITGTSNLVTRTFDQKIQVLPRVSAALPIIGLLSGGATAGIGALLATPVLKALGVDFDRIGLTDYTLKGSWNNPKIVRVQPIRRPVPQERQ